jgi:hypothetical protein
MTLVLSPDPNRPGVLLARLTGTDLDAGVTVEGKPAFPQLGRLCDFLTAAASMPAGRELQWTALGEDFDLRAEAGAEGRALLHVYLGSTSDDACCWQTGASLTVEREELHRAGVEAARVFDS